MYFEFDASRPDPPSFDGPMSRREGFLISVLGHVLLLVLVLLIPGLPFVQEVVQRRRKSVRLAMQSFLRSGW